MGVNTDVKHHREFLIKTSFAILHHTPTNRSVVNIYTSLLVSAFVHHRSRRFHVTILLMVGYFSMAVMTSNIGETLCNYCTPGRRKSAEVSAFRNNLKLHGQFDCCCIRGGSAKGGRIRVRKVPGEMLTLLPLQRAHLAFWSRGMTCSILRHRRAVTLVAKEGEEAMS